jgi:hypothetical protein
MNGPTITQVGGSSIKVEACDDRIRVLVDTSNYISNLNNPPGTTVTTVVSLAPDQAAALAHRLLELAAATS